VSALRQLRLVIIGTALGALIGAIVLTPSTGSFTTSRTDAGVLPAPAVEREAPQRPALESPAPVVASLTPSPKPPGHAIG
jgi:hypothetical protein